MTAVNDLPLSSTVRGLIGTADDADVFHLVGSTLGHAYAASLDVGTGSLQGHVTILDDGRGGAAAGDDYVRLHRVGGAVRVEFVALGGGVFVVVRDSRNLGGGGFGGADFGYTLHVDDVTAAVTAAPLTLPATLNAALLAPGAITLFPFEVDVGADVLFDLVAGGFDGRLFVVSASTGDWIARNDDRAVDDVSPLIDAPLFESGPYLLLVENSDETPSSLAYTLNATAP